MKVRLDELLVARGLAESRSLAQRLVREGKVRVEGNANPKPGNQVRDDAKIEVEAPERFVSRGGWKLEGAFERFGFSVEGLDCLDVGASTGGFTDCCSTARRASPRWTWATTSSTRACAPTRASG